MSGNPLVRFDEGRVGRTARCRPLSYSTVHLWPFLFLFQLDDSRSPLVAPTQQRRHPSEGGAASYTLRVRSFTLVWLHHDFGELHFAAPRLGTVELVGTTRAAPGPNQDTCARSAVEGQLRLPALDPLPWCVALRLRQHNVRRSEERRVGKECRSRWS